MYSLYVSSAFALYIPLFDNFVSNFLAEIFVGYPFVGYLAIAYAVLSVISIRRKALKLDDNGNLASGLMSKKKVRRAWLYSGLWGGHLLHINVYPKVVQSAWLYLWVSFSVVCFSIEILSYTIPMTDILYPVLCVIRWSSFLRFLESWANATITNNVVIVVDILSKFTLCLNLISYLVISSAVERINNKYFYRGFDVALREAMVKCDRELWKLRSGIMKLLENKEKQKIGLSSSSNTYTKLQKIFKFGTSTDIYLCRWYNNWFKADIYFLITNHGFYYGTQYEREWYLDFEEVGSVACKGNNFCFYGKNSEKLRSVLTENVLYDDTENNINGLADIINAFLPNYISEICVYEEIANKALDAKAFPYAELLISHTRRNDTVYKSLMSRYRMLKTLSTPNKH